MTEQSKEDHRKENVATLCYSIEQFDKNIVFIASGALGVSFAFIKDIVPDLTQAHCQDLLVGSWYTFAIVIFICLTCHFVSILGHRWAVDNAHLNDKKFNAGVKSWNRWIRGINIVMIVGLLLGGILLISFINKNINV